MPAAAIIGDDHQVGGHHYREATGDYHVLYNNEEETPRTIYDDDGNDEDNFDDLPTPAERQAQAEAQQQQ